MVALGVLLLIGALVYGLYRSAQTQADREPRRSEIVRRLKQIGV